MRNSQEIKEKVIEILNKSEIPLPTHEMKSSTGITRLLLYYNKHASEEAKQEMKNFLSSDNVQD